MAGVVGGIGFAGGAGIGRDMASFEAIRGSALDIAGKELANPLGVLLAAGLPLDRVGRTDLAERLRIGIAWAINRDGVRTGDTGGRDWTGFAEALAANVPGALRRSCGGAGRRV